MNGYQKINLKAARMFKKTKDEVRPVSLEEMKYFMVGFEYKGIVALPTLANFRNEFTKKLKVK